MPSISDIVTTSRPSQATYFDANGALQTAAPNVWRRDHDPVTKQPRGLLVEPQRARVNVRTNPVNVLIGTDALAGAWIDSTTPAVVPGGAGVKRLVKNRDRTDGAYRYGVLNGVIVNQPNTIGWIVSIGDSIAPWQVISWLGQANSAALFNVVTGEIGTVQSGVTFQGECYQAEDGEFLTLILPLLAQLS